VLAAFRHVSLREDGVGGNIQFPFVTLTLTLNKLPFRFTLFLGVLMGSNKYLNFLFGLGNCLSINSVFCWFLLHVFHSLERDASRFRF